MEREQRTIDDTLTLKFWEPFLRMAHSDGCPGFCPIKVLYGKPNDKPLVFNDLDEAENLLLYGTTGSGKSTFIHVFIKSAMMFNTIEDARFVLVDFKRVEFNQYKNHDLLLCPVIQDKGSLANKLNDLIEMIKHRQTVIGDEGFENYRRNHDKPFPYIVIVIDDYSAVGDADVDLLLQRILKDGHKYGVHVAISTQSLHESIISDKTIKLFKTKICSL